MQTSTARRTRRLLQQLTPQHRRKLARFAQARLRRTRHHLPRGALNHLCGEELVHMAIEATLLGTVSAREGRHPRPDDLVSLDTFLRWLGSVINSQLSNASHARAIWIRRAHDADPPAPSAQPRTAAEQADFRLRLAALLAPLRQEFSHRPALLALLDTWEQHGEDLDRLPGSPFNAHQVRAALRRVLASRPELHP